MGPSSGPLFFAENIAKYVLLCFFDTSLQSCQSTEPSQNTVLPRFFPVASCSAEASFCGKTNAFSSVFVDAFRRSSAFFCAGTWFAPSFCLPHLQNAVCLVKMHTLCAFCCVQAGPCATRKPSNEPWQHNFPCNLRCFLRPCRKIFTTLV